MSIAIRFVGGPADGRSLQVSGDEPPWMYRIPLEPSLADFVTAPLEYRPLQVAEYEPVLADGWPSRADDGAYLYRHRAARLTPEERLALEQRRREAQAAAEARKARLDSAWREVLKERPDFPEDWRDAF